MSQEFEYTIVFDCKPEVVLNMLTSEGFLKKRVEAIESGKYRINVSDESAQIRISGDINARDFFPEWMQKAVGVVFELEEIQTWPKTLNQQGSGSGSIDLNITGKPASVACHAEISSVGSGSQIAFQGTVDVPVKVIGGKIEKYLVGHVASAFRVIEEIGNEWLADFC
jgi:hypothetical protein